MEMVNLAQLRIQVVPPREPIRLQFYQLHQIRLHATQIFLHPRKGTLRLRLMMVLPTHATVIHRTVTTLIQVQVPMWYLHRLKHFLPHTADLFWEKTRLLQVLTTPDLHLYHHQTIRPQARVSRHVMASVLRTTMGRILHPQSSQAQSTGFPRVKGRSLLPLDHLIPVPLTLPRGPQKKTATKAKSSGMSLDHLPPLCSPPAKLGLMKAHL
ncbi:hypothetical protein BKA56DRAFT_592455 [Ilyonectria sp. MPI-CAGE-AT-0026]|nr:hypothetical protein BKA56DRAFT_592455 [Ilyonectria sp. MPI-CAGE-AT-0026]